MEARFDWFVILAGMRTGSNFLEANLTALDGIVCHGEAFNPHFVGYPKRDTLFGFDRDTRERDPAGLLAAIRTDPGGLGGFRYFPDHDPRVLSAILDDPRCAKIVLVRDPLASFVSWKIAQETGQWQLTRPKARRSARVRFDAQAFEDYLGEITAFRERVFRRLQVTGQTAFVLRYEDLSDLEVLNGLAAFLGVADRLPRLDRRLKVQNPGSLADKVENPEEMARTVARLRPDLSDGPTAEPARPAAVRSHVVGNGVPLVFMPIRGGPTEAVESWLAASGNGSTMKDLTQKDMRKWKRANPGHRSFTVLRHPLARAHHVFCRRILGVGGSVYPRIRARLAEHYGVDTGMNGPESGWDLSKHRRAFVAFLAFLDENLAGRTSLRVDPDWGSQAAAVQGFAAFAAPDILIRETTAAAELPELAHRVGLPDPPPYMRPQHVAPFSLAEIYDTDLERAARAAYARDYMVFGFGDWAD